jgi:hypothetical protein
VAFFQDEEETNTRSNKTIVWRKTLERNISQSRRQSLHNTILWKECQHILKLFAFTTVSFCQETPQPLPQKQPLQNVPNFWFQTRVGVLRESRQKCLALQPQNSLVKQGFRTQK